MYQELDRDWIVSWWSYGRRLAVKDTSFSVDRLHTRSWGVASSITLIECWKSRVDMNMRRTDFRRYYDVTIPERLMELVCLCLCWDYQLKFVEMLTVSIGREASIRVPGRPSLSECPVPDTSTTWNPMENHLKSCIMESVGCSEKTIINSTPLDWG